MANQKVSDLADGGAVQATDLFYAERAGSQVSIQGSEIGSSATSFAVDISSDPDTYLFPNLAYDLLQSRIVRVSLSVVSVTADGETWGSGLGEIAAYPARPSSAGMEGQLDDFPVWSGLIDVWHISNANVNNGLHSTDHYQAGLFIIPQHIRTIPNPGAGNGIYQDGGSGALYTGPNHPTMTVRYSFEYS